MTLSELKHIELEVIDLVNKVLDSVRGKSFSDYVILLSRAGYQVENEGTYLSHVASAGGKLPKLINDRNQLREIQYKVSTLEDINTRSDIHINSMLVNRLKDNDIALDDYLHSFIEMAKKGFISVDRSNIGNSNDSMFHGVCIPSILYSGDGLKLKEVKNEIFYINQETDSFDMSVLFGDIMR